MKPFKIDDDYHVDNDEQRSRIRKELANVDDIKSDERTVLLIGSIDVGDKEHVKAIRAVDVNEIVDHKNFISVILYHPSLPIFENELGYDYETDRRIFITFKKK